MNGSVKKASVACSLFLALLLLGSHSYKSFASTQQPTEGAIRTEWRTLSGQEEDRFISLVQRRTNIREELAVLARLFDEKATEESKLDHALLARFSIAEDKSYRFDRKSRALYRVFTPARDNSNELADSDLDTANREVLHKTLTDAETRLFVRCVEAKDRIQVAVQGIRVLNNQKLKQWNKVQDDLLEAFGIQPDADYSYDKGTRTIYTIGIKSSP